MNAKLYSDYVKEQMTMLRDYDHMLFEDTVNGLKKEGWTEEGGSSKFRILSKEGSTIKVFRNAEAPEVIRIRFSAPREEVKLDVSKFQWDGTSEPTIHIHSDL